MKAKENNGENLVYTMRILLKQENQVCCCILGFRLRTFDGT